MKRVGLPEVDRYEDCMRLEQRPEPVVLERLGDFPLKVASRHEVGAAGESVKLLKQARLSARNT